MSNPYSPPATEAKSDGVPSGRPGGWHYFQLLLFSLFGLALAVYWVTAGAISATISTYARIVVGSTFWLGWGTALVSCFVAHLILRVSEFTSSWPARLIAVPLGFVVALMAKYMVDGSL